MLKYTSRRWYLLFSLIVFICGVFGPLQAQVLRRSVFASGGGIIFNNDLAVCISLGESVAGRISTSNLGIQQGFQQQKQIKVSIKDTEIMDFMDYSVFPNPASSVFSIDPFVDPPLRQAEFVLILTRDGHEVFKQNLSETLNAISVQSIPNGFYYLAFFTEDHLLLGRSKLVIIHE